MDARGQDVCSALDTVAKSFCVTEQNFFELSARRSNNHVRDYIIQ
jgi:hypothetical protein